MLRAALYYATHFRWAVLPLHSIRGGRCTCGDTDCKSPGKHPLTKHGVHDATRDADTIRRWWTRWPSANVGIATGRASGFWVLDVDPDKGGSEALHELEAKHGRLPDTVEAITGGGGRHILFRWPGRPVANKVALAPGLDVRGDGGYIAAAPSRHESGRRYAWEVSSRPGEVPMAAAPAWLLALVDDGAARNGSAVSAEEWRKLAAFGVAEGARNNTIARFAGHLLRRGVDPYVTALLMLALNEARFKPPLDAAEVLRTVNSIAKAEARRRGLLHRGRSA
ncbi:DNA primase [Thermaerobacter sp. FW80]|uniref:bifunctional DNA primase/polymerase n=1 Tax=Thermaerobacter sp. FW80 TaxID=2546351 RepID=UPI0010752245|nr:bifunctional DNA primase/polymerase [Thermaerobacter sp. FW80]QBS37113.1 DNA primase [Thermaerobacter sp. FW80]